MVVVILTPSKIYRISVCFTRSGNENFIIYYYMSRTCANYSNNIEPITLEHVRNMFKRGIPLMQIDKQTYSLLELRKLLQFKNSSKVPHSRRKFTNKEYKTIMGSERPKLRARRQLTPDSGSRSVLNTWRSNSNNNNNNSI